MFKKDFTFRGKKLTKSDMVLIVVAIVLVALYFLLSNLNTSSGNDNKTLNTKVSAARTAYNQAAQNGNVEALEEDKTEIQARIDELDFPDKDKAGEIIVLILDWAQQSGMQVTASLSSSSSATTLGGYSCLATVVSVSVKGSVTQLTAFFDYIENSDINTLVTSNIVAYYTAPDWKMEMQVTAYTKTG